jgi:hypothetical protein
MKETKTNEHCSKEETKRNEIYGMAGTTEEV